MAGFWRSLVRNAFTIPDVSATFSAESTPQLIDRMYRSWLGSDASPHVDRLSALSVPAVQRGRNLICGEISTLPLVLYGPNNRPVEHSLFRQIDPDVPNAVTLSQTLEDLLFEGVSWWKITGFGSDGYPTQARHLDVGSVTVREAAGRSPSPLPSGIDPRGGRVYVDGVEVPWDEIIGFQSLNPGLLKVAGRVIRRALALDKAAAMYADTPLPLMYFTPTEGADPADDETIQAVLDEWASTRQDQATAYVPAALKLNFVDLMSPKDLQLVELQKQATLEIANAIGLDPEDMGISTTSRTYQNAIDRRYDRINGLMAPYMRAIEQRLSMPDVTKRGYAVRFDLDDYLRADPMSRWKTYEVAKNMGAITVDEIREEERMPALTPQQRLEVAPPAPPEPTRNPQAVAASERPRLTLSRESGLTFENVPSATFSVDEESRTITGLAVPWGQFAQSGGRRYRFQRGGIKWSQTRRVKLLRDHDNTQALGYAVRLEDTSDGLMATFKVARGRAGDEALALAADGVLDGLSIGVDFTDDAITKDPNNAATLLVGRAALREVSLTAMPAFDDSRIASVRMAREDEGSEMTDDATTEPQAPAAPAAAPETATFNLDALAEAIAAKLGKGEELEQRPVVNPTRVAMTSVKEALPYRFTYQGGRHVFRSDAEHDFSTDLFAVLSGRHAGRDVSAPMARVDGFIQAAFADVETADVTALNPNRHRPDMWQPQMDYATPLWDMVNSGATDGTAFEVPKFDSASGLVGPATEKVEPAGGSMTATLQTITPTQVWGKVEVSRQAWRAGGNPQLSGILWDQMLREYYEDREAAVATFLNTLTAATDITLTGTPAVTPGNADDQVTASDLEAAIADLQFVRGGNRFRAFAVHQDLYQVLARVKDSSGRPLYPQISPMNANGTASSLFSTLNVAGTTAVPSWALGSGGQTTPTNSWLFDPAKVRGWASAPERLFWDFGATVQTANIPQLSFVTLGIYGDVAFANLDINGVRQVVFDPSV